MNTIEYPVVRKLANTYITTIDTIRDLVRGIVGSHLSRELEKQGLLSDWSHLLNHVSFIMDGNRTEERLRYERTRTKIMATLLQKEDTFGHYQGFLNAKKVLEICSEKNVPYTSFWALSDDNIAKRSEEERKYLFTLLESALPDIAELSQRNNIRIIVIGNRQLLPRGCVDAIERAEYDTKDNTGTTVLLGIGYGGVDEVLRAIHVMAESGIDMKSAKKEDLFQALETAGDIPPADLIVRTGGQLRLSGWLPMTGIHSEYYFSKRNWPRFDTIELFRAIVSYIKRTRKFGK